MTFCYNGFCPYYNPFPMFRSNASPAWVTFDLRSAKNIKSIFFSAFEYQGGYDGASIGNQFSVGETFATSTFCYKATNYIKSMWISCGGGVTGSKIFVYNQSGGWLNLVELTAYELYFVQQNIINFDGSTLQISGSSFSCIKLKEMNVMTGTETSCYTSEKNDYPAIKLRFKAEFKINAAVIVLQVSQTTQTINSNDYSSNLTIAIYDASDTLVGLCTSLPNPLT